jgi:probable HAF family extracellular repeat protein
VLSNGSFSTFAYPGSGGYYSTAYGINNTGQIVGFCETEFYGTLGPCQDFYGVPDGWVESGESYARVSFPGAISYTTDAIGINDQGQVTGEYELPSGAVYGYLLSGGSYTTINPSNSSGSGAYGINNAGDIVGYYCTNSNCTIAGFLQSGGNTTTITVPGATSTTAWGVNNSDDVVGYYTNASGVYGGFLWQEGQFTLLSDPLGVQTYATGINDAGQIVGYYQDGNGVLHGFVTAPAGATAATVTLGSLNQTYTGSPLSATATTTPVGLAVTFTYNGSATPPTAAGSYTVVGTINSPGYQGSATGTLVIAKATATVTLGSLNQTYTGSPLSASATTSPGGLTVIFTYNGSPTAPTAVGSYTVVGTINDPNYQGSASGTLIIAAPIPCPLSLSAPGESFSTEGGVGSFSVTPGPSCTWSAKSNVSWISVLSLPIIPLGFEVISPANVIYEVSANSGAARSGTISVGAQTYSITQAGFSCSYSIGPTFAATADTGGSVAVSVSAPAGCSWRATANVPWMTVKSGASGSGGGVVVLSVSANTGASRSGTATIAGQTFTVTEGSGDCGALDVGSKASVSASQLIQFPYFGLNPENLNEYSQTITVRNNSYSPIPGPVYVVLLGEPHNNPFNNDSDLLGTFLTTTCFSSQPSYLLNMPLPASGTLPPGQTSEYPVTWVTEESGTVVYSTKVLSGKPSH